MSNATEKYAEWTLITDLRVRPSDRRIKIHGTAADRYGIEAGDDLSVELVTDDGYEVYLGRLTVQTRHRITVPNDIFEDHDLGDEYVDMRFRYV